MNTERLYKLLPAIYRMRDTVRGEPLRALLAVIESELELIESDIDGLYENWFIETCDDWVVPYIGDLLDVRELYAESSRTYGQERRAYVANTLAYRRRKGTAPVLEQLARDITGWRSRAVEFFERLATTQNINHIRQNNVLVDLRSSRQPERLGTPFEQRVAYTTEVRRISSSRGKYNIPNIGLFMWRLQSYPIHKGTARAVNGRDSKPTGRYYTFNPLGIDNIPLFNRPQTEIDAEITYLAEEINLPGPLRRQALAAGNPPASNEYWTADPPVLQIFINGQPTAIPPEEILIRDLSQWDAENKQQPSSKTEAQPDGKTLKVAVDPESGRLAFLTEQPPKRVEVSYSYGFSGDIGGGPYDRSESIASAAPPSVSRVTWKVPQDTSTARNPLAEAVRTWNKFVRSWQCCQDKICIPLSRLAVASTPSDGKDQTYTAQILNGLTVTAYPGTSEAIVKPGKALDSQRNPIHLQTDCRVDLSAYVNQTVLLFISYQFVEGRHHGWQIHVVPEEKVASYPEMTYIRLARLVMDSKGKISQSDTQGFTPGIIEGLTVTAKPGATEAILTPGRAVDSQGHLIDLKINYRVDLRPYPEQTVLLLISYKDVQREPRWQINVVPDADTKSYPAGTYIRLARLAINPKGRVSGQSGSNVRRKFTPGIVQGLTVAVVDADSTQAAIAPGIAINSKGQLLKLGSNETLDLSAYPGKTVTVFIDRKPRQGGKKVDVVPEVDMGVITIKDNRSYRDNLSITIPANKQLQIIAANECRPHLQGNVSVRGTAANNPGELVLDGLLVEGKLTVQPGNLKHLRVTHCTLFPREGGLVVEKAKRAVEPEECDESFSLIALVMYCLTFLRRRIGLGTDLNCASPQENLSQLVQLVMKQAMRVFSLLKIATCHWQSPDEPEDSTEEDNPVLCCWQSPEEPEVNAEEDNSFLSIAIDRSICGSINLADTVTKLDITDSIIDKGSDRASRAAIAAPGAAVDLITTTVFGKTSVRSLEASNCIFNETVTALRHQVGCVRFCYLPEESQTPRRYRCQPDLTLAKELVRLPDDVTTLAIDTINKQIFIFAGTAGGGIFRSTDNGENWQQFNSGLTNTHVTSLAIDASKGQIFAGTMGGNVFRSTNNGENWTLLNSGLNTNTNIAALAVNKANGQVFAGTTGGGVFRLPDNGNTWTAVNRGLTNLDVTKLAAANGQIVAGTNGDGVFRSTDSGENWTLVNPTSTDEEATSRFVYVKPGTGKISSRGTIVRGTETDFARELGKGDAIEAAGQIRTIVDVADTTLTIDEPFRPDLSAETSFTVRIGLPNPTVTSLAIHPSNEIFAGIADGLFRCASDRNLWTPVNIGLTDTDVTALAINEEKIFAGTNLGSILRSMDNGDRWTAVNRGLVNVDEKMLILSRLQPRFTSTHYGDPGYAQLSQSCAPEIRTGGEDGSEMGVFYYLKQPQREANLRASLDEYLRFGLEAGIFYVT